MKNINKIIEYGLYLLVFILPVQTRWIIKAGEINGGYSEYNTISLFGSDILLSALLFLFVIYKFQTGNKSEINPKFQIQNYWRFIAALELFIFISIFFAPDKLLAVYKYGVFLLGVGFFWLIAGANYNKVKLIFSLLAGILSQAILGIWQFLTQSSFSSKWLGLAAHKAGELGVSVIEVIGSDGVGERWLRAYGGLDHPNVLGGLLAVGILLIVASSLRTNKDKNQTQNSKLKTQNRNLKLKVLFFVTCYLLLVACLFFTFSRGAWLGLATGFIIIFALLAWKKDFIRLKKFLELALIGGVMTFLLFNVYGDLARTRIYGGTRLENKSYVERISSMEEAKEIIKNKWLFGAGMGNYTLELRNNEKKYRPSFYFQPVHNVFLLVWAEIGLFGLLAFLGLLAALARQAVKAGKAFCGLPVLSAFIIMMFVDHWLWSLRFGMLFFWLIMGLLVRNEDMEQNVI